MPVANAAIDPLAIRLTKYITQRPHPKQHAFLAINSIEALFGGSAGPGKMLHIETPIPTPTGWTTMGELRVGDELFTEHGQICRITRVHPVDPHPESYRLVFDDGTEIEACADHQWLTFDALELGALTRRSREWRAARRERRPSRAKSASLVDVPYGYCKCGCGAKTNLVKSSRAKQGLIRGEPRDYLQGHAPASSALREIVTERNRRSPTPTIETPQGTVRTTRRIAESLRTPTGRVNHAVPVAKALVLPEAELPINPYCLGAWLGDGTTTSAGFTTADPEILEHFHAVGIATTKTTPRYGYVLGDREWQQCSNGKMGWVRSFSADLRRLGVRGNKHIPDIYLRASVEQRVALVQGLMDTDGYVDKRGSVSFSSSNRRLAEDVYELLISLGWKISWKERRAKIKGKDCGPCWVLSWSADRSVFRLARKVERQVLATRRTTRFRYITSCREIASEPMRCITVDNPTGLYLAGRSMVPTHNSSSLLMAALQYVDIPGYAAIIFRQTYPDLARPGGLMFRSKEWLMKTDAKWHEGNKMWTFPSGATLSFGHLEHSDDKFAYQGAEYQFLGWDELTQFLEADYRYLFSRLRKPPVCEVHQDATGRFVDGKVVCEVCGEEGSLLSLVPLRCRAASNPGGRGHVWCRSRFIKKERSDMDDELGIDPSERVFVPAKLSDNPSVNQAAYIKQLQHLDPQTRQQLLEGDWDARSGAVVFSEFRYQRHTHPESRHLGSPYEVYHFMDFGFHHSPCLWVEVQGNRAFVFAECDTWDEQDLHSKAEQIKQIDGEFDCLGAATYVDPAGLGQNIQTGKTDAQVLLEAGINVLNLDNSDRFGREQRTSFIKYCIRTDRLIVSQDCSYLIESLEKAEWEHDPRTGALRNFYKKDGLWEHPLDALGEGLIRVFRPFPPAAVTTQDSQAAVWSYSGSQFGG